MGRRAIPAVVALAILLASPAASIVVPVAAQGPAPESPAERGGGPGSLIEPLVNLSFLTTGGSAVLAADTVALAVFDEDYYTIDIVYPNGTVLGGQFYFDGAGVLLPVHFNAPTPSLIAVFSLNSLSLLYFDGISSTSCSGPYGSYKHVIFGLSDYSSDVIFYTLSLDGYLSQVSASEESCSLSIIAESPIWPGIPWDFDTNGVYAAGKRGDLVVWVEDNVSYGGTYLSVVVWNLTSDNVSWYSVDAGTDAGALYASSYIRVSGLRTADVAVPWYAGYAGRGRLIIVNVLDGTIRTLNLTARYGVSNVTLVRFIDWRGSPAVVLVGLLSNSTIRAPIVAVLDVATGEVVASRILGDLGSVEPRAVLGDFPGGRAVYVAGAGRLAVVLLSNLTVAYTLETGVEYPRFLWYDRIAGQKPLAVLGVSGFAGNGTGVTRVYKVNLGVEVERAVVSLQAPEEAIVGEPFTVTVTLTGAGGEPVAGAVVVVEEFNGSAWRPLTTLVTGSDGVARGQVVLWDRGPLLLRARFPGGGGYLPAVSQVVEVDSFLLVSASIRLSQSATVQGIPVAAIVRVTDNASGSPVGGLWVRVEANVSGGWASVGTGLTSDAGEAVIPLNLPAGTYKLRASVVDPYVSMTGRAEAVLRVYRFPAPPAGPYISPVGRILAFAPPIAEAGENATVLFVFYYGESIMEPESYDVIVTPATPHSVEEVEPGIYMVSLEPPSPGVYTVLFKARLGQAVYVGSAVVYAANITGSISSIESRLEGLVATIYNVNQTLFKVVEDLLQSINTSLERYLSTLNETLWQLNITRLVGLIESLDNKTSRVLVILGDYRDLLDSMNASLSEQVEALVSLSGAVASGNRVLLEVNSSLASLADLVNKSSNLIAGLVIENWRGIEGLNETVESLAETFNTSLDGVELLIDRYGEVLVSLNVSLHQLARSLNASLASLIRDASGDILAVVNTSTGAILARLSDIGYNISLVSARELEISTELGKLRLGLDEALHDLGLIRGEIVSVNTTIAGLEAVIRISNGSIASILLSDLKPRILDIADGLALINTTIGLLVGNMTTLTRGLSGVAASTEDVAKTLGQINATLNKLASSIGRMASQAENASLQAGAASRNAREARMTSMASAGLAGLSLLLAVTALARARKP